MGTIRVAGQPAHQRDGGSEDAAQRGSGAYDGVDPGLDVPLDGQQLHEHQPERRAKRAAHLQPRITHQACESVPPPPPHGFRDMLHAHKTADDDVGCFC